MAINATIVGNITNDPILSYTTNGKARIGFGIAVQRGKDAPVTYYNCTAWEDIAVNIAACLRRGDRVIATVEIRPRQYEVEGQKRTTTDFTIRDIGPSLRWTTAEPQRVERKPANKTDKDDGGAETVYSDEPF